jgi:hypothetical protein
VFSVHSVTDMGSIRCPRSKYRRSEGVSCGPKQLKRTHTDLGPELIQERTRAIGKCSGSRRVRSVVMKVLHARDTKEVGFKSGRCE